MLPSEGSNGKSVSLPFPASVGYQHPLSHGPFPPSSEPTGQVRFPWHHVDLPFRLPLPLFRTLVITLCWPRESRAIFLFQDQLISNLHSICNFNFSVPCDVTYSTYSQVPQPIRHFGGRSLFCLTQLQSYICLKGAVSKAVHCFCCCCYCFLREIPNYMNLGKRTLTSTMKTAPPICDSQSTKQLDSPCREFESWSPISVLIS